MIKPPVAITVLLALILWIDPSAIDIQITPLQAPYSSIIKSSKKYSTKNMQSYPRALPNKVWSIECPVLSATQAVR